MLHFFIFYFLLIAVYVLDIFMDGHRIASDRLGIVSICCLLLAAKIEERENNIPRIADLQLMLGEQFLLSEFVALEGMILKFFEFQLMIPTAATFLEYFIEGIVDDSDYDRSNTNLYRFHSLMAMKRELADLALEFVELILSNVYMMQELPSKMAAACLAAARSTLEVGEVWPKHLLILTNYSLNEIGSQQLQLQLLRLNVMNATIAGQLKSSTSNTPDSGYISHGDVDLDETDVSGEEQD